MIPSDAGYINRWTLATVCGWVSLSLPELLPLRMLFVIIFVFADGAAASPAAGLPRLDSVATGLVGSRRSSILPLPFDSELEAMLASEVYRGAGALGAVMTDYLTDIGVRLVSELAGARTRTPSWSEGPPPPSFFTSVAAPVPSKVREGLAERVLHYGGPPDDTPAQGACLASVEVSQHFRR